MKVISIADPENPEVTWEFIPPIDNSFTFYGIDITDEYIYEVACGGGGEWEESFHVWDKRNIEDVQIVGMCNISDFESKLVVSGDYAYVISVIQNGGLLSIVSIEDPTNPGLVNTIQLLPSSPRDCTVEGGYLYISHNKLGFSIYGLDNPEMPELVAWYDTPYSSGGFSYYNNLHVRDSYVFLQGMIYDCADVTGRWNVDLSEASHDFIEVQIHSDSTWQFTISNLAQQPVEILDIVSDSLAFTVDFDTAFTLEPEEEALLTVTFTPTERRIYTGQLTIRTERRDLTVWLSGTGVDLSAQSNDNLPLEFALRSAYPNPFNSMTSISYSIPTQGNVRLSVYDLNGREVTVLREGRIQAGNYQATWDAGSLPSGLYICSLEAGSSRLTQKLVLIR